MGQPVAAGQVYRDSRSGRHYLVRRLRDWGLGAPKVAVVTFIRAKGPNAGVAWWNDTSFILNDDLTVRFPRTVVQVPEDKIPAPVRAWRDA